MSQKCPKDRGTYSICWFIFKVQRSAELLLKHVPRNKSCPGFHISLVISLIQQGADSSQNETGTWRLSQTAQASQKLDLQTTDATAAIDSGIIEKDQLSHPP